MKSVGIGVNDPAFALRALRSEAGAAIDTVMIAGSWNLLDHSALDLLRYCQDKRIAVHNAGVFATGLLVGGSTVRYAPAPRELIDRARRWRVLCQKHDLSIQSVALAFAWLPQCVTRVAVGVKSVPELAENVKSLRASVPRQLWLDAKKEGLLPPQLHFPM